MKAAVETAVARPRTTWAWCVGTFFGLGLLKPAPGTWGSAGGLLVWSALLPTASVPSHLLLPTGCWPPSSRFPSGSRQARLAYARESERS